jgi:hypothetical protein
LISISFRRASIFGLEPLGAQKQRNGKGKQEEGASLGYLASGVEAMITATWTWKDIRDFEEDPSRYQRSQMAWALVLAVPLILVIALFG